MSLMPAGIILYLKLTSPTLSVLYGESFGMCAMTLSGDLCVILLLGAELLILKCRRKAVCTFYYFFMTAFWCASLESRVAQADDGIVDKESPRLFLDRCRLWKSGRNGDEIDKRETVKFIRQATESRRVRMGLIRRNCRFRG